MGYVFKDETTNAVSSAATTNSGENKYNYTLLVKKRLSDWKKEFETEGMTLNYSAISDVLEQKYNVTASPALISQTFKKGDPREVRLDVLTALSQMFDIPLWDICHHPNEESTSIHELVKYKDRSSYAGKQPITNKYYEGSYYCYYFKPQHYDDSIRPVSESRIEEAILDIRIVKGRTQLTMRELNTADGFYGEPIKKYTMTGDLHRYDKTNIAYGFVCDSEGRRHMSIMFRYFELNTDTRYWIQAGFMTVSEDQIHYPVFEKMTIFRARQNLNDPKNTEIIRGLLALDSTPIVLDEITRQSLAEDDALADALSLNRALLRDCTVYSEAAIRSSLFQIHDRNEKAGALLKVLSHGLLPARQAVIEHQSYVDFARALQIKQIRDRD